MPLSNALDVSFDNDRAIVGLTATGHALVHTYELSVPIFMTVWLAELGASEAALGLAVTAGYALFGIGAVPGGVLADRYGSKRLVVACLAGMGGSFVLLSLAQGLWLIAGGLVLWGAAASVYHPAGLALISKGARRRGHVFAYHGIAGNLGTALGPLSATVLLLFFDWRVVCALLALPALAAVPLLWAVKVDETAAVEEERKPLAGSEAEQRDAGFSWTQFWGSTRALFASAFGLIFAAIMLEGMYYRGALTFLPELLGELASLAPVEAGAVTLQPGRFVYVGLLLVGMAGQYLGGRMTDRVRLAPAIAATFAALAVIALLFLPVARLGLVPLLGMSALLGVVLFGVQPLYQAAIAEHSPAGARGLSYGYNYLGVFGVGALGAALAGGVLSVSTPAVLFGVLAALVAGAAALMLVLARRERRSQAGQEAA